MKFISKYKALCLLLLISTAYAELPPKVQLDMKMLGLAEQLKNEDYYNAFYSSFPEIETLSEHHNLPLEDSFYYYRAEAAFKLSENSLWKEYDEAKKSLEIYIEKTGADGKFYMQTLSMLQDISANPEKVTDTYYLKAIDYADYGGVYKYPFSSASAVEYYTKASKNGHIKAMLAIAHISHKGCVQVFINNDGSLLLDVVNMENLKNIDKAIFWYEQIIDAKAIKETQATANAAYMLAWIYYTGEGVAVNKQKAADYFDLSASFSPGYKSKAIEMASNARK